MVQPPVPQRNPVTAHPVTSAAIAVVLIATVFFALYVPLYARDTPKVGDFPFFYFFLLIYMPVVSLACWLVLVLQTRLRTPRDGGAR